MTMDCLTDQQLELSIRGDGEQQWNDHVSACNNCRKRLETIRGNLEMMDDILSQEPGTILLDSDAGRCFAGGTDLQSTLGSAEGFDKYEVRDLLAEGGMGAIHVGQDRRLRRLVAMKVVLGQRRSSSGDVLRFVEEAQVMGQLEHPNIVPVHELGTDPDGNPYYTMKLVRGNTLGEILQKIAEGDKNTIDAYPLISLLNVFLKVCDAVAFAHSKGVIHRDLKPENIMVGEYGEVLVVDWGVAKIIGKVETSDDIDDKQPDWAQGGVESIRQDDASQRTMTGAIVGTPHFMAPEQAFGRLKEIDARTDIYALGGILYNILTLDKPISGKTVKDVLRKVVTGEITSPLKRSRKLSKDGQGNSVGPKLPHCPYGEIPDALAAVAMKALSLEQADRYGSVTELQAEIERWEGGYATEAEEADLWRQLTLLVARHRREFSMGAVAAIVLLAGATVAFWRVNEERKVAKANAILAQRNADDATQQRAQAEANAVLAQNNAAAARANEELAKRSENEAIKAKRKVEETLKRILSSEYAKLIALADRSIEKGEFNLAHEALEKCSPDFRNWEWRRLSLACRLDLKLDGGRGTNKAIFSHDGSLLLTRSEYGFGPQTMKVWDTRNGNELVSLKLGRDSCLTFSPDGKRVVVGGLGNATAKVLDARTGKEITFLNGHGAAVVSVAYSPDGTRIVTGSKDNTARVWDAETSRELLTLRGHRKPVGFVGFSSDGTRIVTGSEDLTAKVWDAKTGRELFSLGGHEKAVTWAMFSAGGNRIHTRDLWWNSKVWDAQSGRELLSFSATENRVLATSPDGKLALVQGRPPTVWDMESGTPWLDLEFDRGKLIRKAAFSPDGARILTVDYDQKATLWDATTGKKLFSMAVGTFNANDPAFSPDGKRVCIFDIQRSHLGIWDVRVDRVPQRDALSEHDRRWRTPPLDKDALATHWRRKRSTSPIAVHPDGRTVLLGGSGTAVLREIDTGRLVMTFKGHKSNVDAVAFSPDATRVVTGSWDKTARVWEVKSGKQQLLLKGHKDEVKAVAFGPDGKRVATGSDDKTVRLWDGETGMELMTLHVYSPVRSIAFSPDGNLLAIAAGEKTAIWNSKTGERLVGLIGHTGRVHGMVFNPDGTQVVTASWDKTARVWDAYDGRQLLVLDRHRDAVNSALYSHDGKRILTASYDGTAKIWDAGTGVEVLTLRHGKERLQNAAFSADGNRIFTNGLDDFMFRVWYTEENH